MATAALVLFGLVETTNAQEGNEAASSRPEVTSVNIDKRSKGVVVLRAGATDADATVTGLRVGWGDGSGVVASRNCPRAGSDALDRPDGNVVTFRRLRHRYARPGRYTIRVTARSQDCSAPATGHQDSDSRLLNVRVTRADLRQTDGVGNPRPRITSLRFASPPRVGRTTRLIVEARDPDATVVGVEVGFGRQGGVVADSTCRRARGRGEVTRFVLFHRFRRPGRVKVTATARSVRCPETRNLQQSVPRSTTVRVLQPVPRFLG